MDLGRLSDWKGLLAPDVPIWACELTATHVVVVGTDSKRQSVRNQFSARLPEGVVAGELKEANIVDPEAVRSAVGEALDRAGFNGSELALVIPDEAVRVSLLSVDSFPSAGPEQEKFIRWKLKKSVPFDVAGASLAYQVLGGNGTVDLLVTVSPASVVRQYEELIESFDLHPGIVVPSTLAAFNLLDGLKGDTFFVKVAPSVITTSVFLDQRLRFYRKVPRRNLYDAVYPTFMYYQDKLGGTELAELVFCGDETSADEHVPLGNRLGVPVRRLGPTLSDLYKPALGVLQA